MNQPPTDEPGAPGTLTPSVRQKPASMARYKRELRREIKRRAHEPEINFLNIVAMLDMMTIILVFLLKSMAASTASMPQNDQLKLPLSALAPDAPSEPAGLAVVVSKRELIIGDETQSATIGQLPSVDSDKALGFDASMKANNDRNQLEIEPLRKRIGPWRERDMRSRMQRNEDPGSEARIIADSTTTYRILYEVIFTLAHNGFTKFHLMVLQGAGKK